MLIFGEVVVAFVLVLKRRLWIKHSFVYPFYTGAAPTPAALKPAM